MLLAKTDEPGKWDHEAVSVQRACSEVFDEMDLEELVVRERERLANAERETWPLRVKQRERLTDTAACLSSSGPLRLVIGEAESGT